MNRTKSPVAAGSAIELLAELVRRPSITPDDSGCQRLLATRLKSCGFTTEMFEFGNVSNLWARLGRSQPVLCFAGHTDVVPPGDIDAWRTQPFEPVIRDDRLVGRGAADMKSGLAAMIVAAETFVAQHPRFNGSLAFLLTSDEEGDAIDGTARVMERLANRGERIAWCLIGEPSSNRNAGDTIRIGRRGSLSAELTIRGRQGHVAYPDQIDNPIRQFAPALADLYSMDWPGDDKRFPTTSFQVVHLEAGNGVLNITPQDLKVRFNFRYSPDWNEKRLMEVVTDILDSHSMNYDITWQAQGEPFVTGPGQLIDAVVAAVHENTGTKPTLSTGGGTSDGRFIAPHGVDVVELGPPNDSIHQVNEFVRLSCVSSLVDMYKGVAERLLVTD